MAHHMAGKFTIHDLRPYPVRVANPLSYNCSPDGIFNHADALTTAEGLAEKGFRPRVDFAVTAWFSGGEDRITGGAALTIHDRAETLWQEWKAKQPKPKPTKVVVELWGGDDTNGYRRFGVLIVISRYGEYETRVAFKREEATEFESVTPEQVAKWHKDLGSPENIKLIPAKSSKQECPAR